MRLVILALVLLSSIAYADKVAVIDTDRLYQKGGIAKWLAARAKLDEDRKSFRVAESPNGNKPTPVLGTCDASLMGNEYCKRMEKIEADLRDTREWKKVEQSVLDPIEAEVTAAIQAYAKAQRIDILLPKEETIYVAPSADITDAFIKSFNAKPLPKPTR